MDEEYTQSDISKEVERLMDEEGFEFGEAVKEAMAQGYKDGGLMIAIKNLAQGGMTYGDKTYHQYHDQYVPPDSENMMYANGGGIGSMMIPKRGLVNEPGGYSGRTLGDIFEHGYFMQGPTYEEDLEYYKDLAERRKRAEEEFVEDDVFSIEDIFERDTPLTEGIFGLSEGFTLSPITLLRRYLANKELENKVDYADGGRVGLFMGGPPLTGEALNIYTSMNAYGYTDQEIADRLSGSGLYTPPGSTPPTTPPTTPPSSGGGGGGGGEGNGFGTGTTTTKTRDKKIDEGITAANADKGSLTLEEITAMNDLSGQESMRGQIPPKTTLEKIISSDKPNMKDIAGEDLAINFDITDLGNPTNDPRVVSEELGIIGIGKPNMKDVAGDISTGTTDLSKAPSKAGITTISRPNMRDIAGPSTTVDESISIEDFSKPSNIGDFNITTSPALTNQTGIISDLSNIAMAKDPDVEDPFEGKYTPSFEEKKAAEGILEGLLEKAANFSLSDLKTMGTNFSINKALQTLGFANIPSFLGTKAITTGFDYFKNKQVQKEIEKQAAATKTRKETREIQDRLDKQEDNINKNASKNDSKTGASTVNPNSTFGKKQGYTGGNPNPHTTTGWSGSSKSSKSSSTSSNTGTKSGGGGKGGGADSGGSKGGGGRNSSDRGGGFGGLGFSDIRLKDNIELVGKSKSDINIYNFTYLNDLTVYQGVMAHEVPWASVKHDSGYLMVDYNKVDVDFKSIR